MLEVVARSSYKAIFVCPIDKKQMAMVRKFWHIWCQVFSNFIAFTSIGEENFDVYCALFPKLFPHNYVFILVTDILHAYNYAEQQILLARP